MSKFETIQDELPIYEPAPKDIYSPAEYKRRALEGLHIEELKKLKTHLLEQYSQIEADIHLVNDVLDGYGVEDS